MKEYMAVWYDGYRMIYSSFEAENIKEAKIKGFQLMCDNSGDRLWDVEIWECKYKYNCNGEFNPKPLSYTSNMATRDYETGKKKKKVR